MRLAAWASWYAGHDGQPGPDGAANRRLVRSSCVGLEFRPPLSISKPLRKALREEARN